MKSGTNDTDRADRNAASPSEVAVFDMLGFGCVSCVHAIERCGRRIEGVEDIRIDLAKREIRLVYDGRPEALNKLRDLVVTLGHDVRLRS